MYYLKRESTFPIFTLQMNEKAKLLTVQNKTNKELRENCEP